VYKSQFKESIEGEFGKGGFLSNQSYEDISKTVDPVMIIMEINDKLLTLSDKNDGLAKLLNKLEDMRVDERKYRGKLAITYPLKVSKNPKLVKVYDKLTKEALKNV